MYKVKHCNQPPPSPSPSLSADIQGSCATNGDGLYEGLSWVQSTLTTKQMKKSVSQPTAEVKDSLTGKGGLLSSWVSSLSNYFTHNNSATVTESES